MSAVSAVPPPSAEVRPLRRPPQRIGVDGAGLDRVGLDRVGLDRLGVEQIGVNLITLGCARNEVDSSEIAGRLELGGYRLVADPADAAVVVVNTCAFVAAAKKDSIDTVLAAADTGAKVVAVGCLAERYGAELAQALPEADAVLGFDAYPDLAALLGDVVDGHRPPAHTPVDRRLLLPITPTARPSAARAVSVPGHGPIGASGPVPASGPTLVRTLLQAGPVAPLKIASGCDRRCTFCAIPSFRGAFVSRPIADIVTEAGWLADQGVREIVLVSENSTSYGKDLPGQKHLHTLLAELGAVAGIERIRLSYLQPAETRPWLIEAIASTPRVADYYDMSFQHAAEPVLRRMRRYGSRPAFLQLIEQIRSAAPEAGIRSNVIVGFPGETEDDLAELEAFLIDARMDAVGVFGYSDEDGTAAADLAGKHDADVIAARVERVTSLAEELTAQRAEDRIGTQIVVLVDAPDRPVYWNGAPVGTQHVDTPPDTPPGAAPDTAPVVGRGPHQAPEVDGNVTIDGLATRPAAGALVRCVVTGSSGIDLSARAIEVVRP